MSPARAIARRAFADARTRTLAFALLFAGVAAANTVGYRRTYPTVADRLEFARSFGADKSVRFFYGVPHDLLSVGGYVAWRVGGIVSIFAAMWGLLAAVRALRTEEDAGRQELVLAGAVTRRGAYLAALAAIAVGTTVLAAALFLGLVAAGLPPGGSGYLALAIVSVVPVFVGVGALASQIAPTRRAALELGTAVLAVTFLVRVVADTTSLETLRWVTPLGWVEELRAFAEPRPLVLVLPAAVSAALLIAAGLVSAHRDVGVGLVRPRDRAEPSYRLLGSPTRHALRSERGSLAGWTLGVGGFAFMLGVVSSSVSASTLPERVREELEAAGLTRVATPAGYLGFTFLFFAFALSLFACSQVAAARREESEQQLEVLLALPVSRTAWFGGRLLLAVACATAIALSAGVLAWVGAASQRAPVSLPEMLGAGTNCLPTAILFLGIGALAFALSPRAGAGIAYGLTCLAFVWGLFGALLRAPAWVLGLSPFHRIGLVPAQSFKPADAAAMLVVGGAAALAAVFVFARRDLTGA